MGSCQGEYNVFNALIAIAVGLELDISLEDIKKGIQEFKLTKNRMDILEKNHKTIIDGTYNASVDSMKSSIDVLTNYKNVKFYLADMLDLEIIVNNFRKKWETMLLLKK